jgi:hypothetical protein
MWAGRTRSIEGTSTGRAKRVWRARSATRCCCRARRSRWRARPSSGGDTVALEGERGPSYLIPCASAHLRACPRGRQVKPPPEPEWPDWLVDLWQGWPGREHGEEGLIRSAARRYSRQLHNGLSLASQKLNERSFPTRDGRVGWAPSVILEGRVRRRIGSLMGGRVATPRYAEMYVHDAMFGQHSAEHLYL